MLHAFVSVPADSVQSHGILRQRPAVKASTPTGRARLRPRRRSVVRGSWALPKIGWDQAYGSVTPSGSSTIAVLDTGVDASVADLSGRILSGYSAFGTDPATDPNGHGTWLASIAAAATDNGSGIAGVDFANVNVAGPGVPDASGTGQTATSSRALSTRSTTAQVILMGFSNPGRSEALQAAVDYAWSHEKVVRAAAGNDINVPDVPRRPREVVGVAATHRRLAVVRFGTEPGGVHLGAPAWTSRPTMPRAWSASQAPVLRRPSSPARSLYFSEHPRRWPGVIVGRLARNTDPGGAGNGRPNPRSSAIAPPMVVPMGAPGVARCGSVPRSR